MAECSIDGCLTTARTRGWCNKHYLRWRKHGDPLIAKWEPKALESSCTVGDCASMPIALGMCSMHYERMRRTGTTDPTRTDELRFHAFVERVGECWEWRGERDRDGYGYFWADRKRHRVHRWSYEHFVGPIPDGLVLDHLCRNRSCANPRHLEPVTTAENVRRWSSTITHCPAGHEYTTANTRVYNGKRSCVQCTTERKRSRRTLISAG